VQNTREFDRTLLNTLPKATLIELLFTHLRSLWSVDGLYFIGIEERFGTEAATDIDRKVWEIMGKIEARRITGILQISGNDIQTVMKALRLTGWALDLEYKEIEVMKHKAVIRNRNCRVQQTRLKKELEEFPCKSVRWAFLRSFVKELNPALEVRCEICPPDDHPDDLWCEWVIQ
jgi:hypothetical protein